MTARLHTRFRCPAGLVLLALWGCAIWHCGTALAQDLEIRDTIDKSTENLEIEADLLDANKELGIIRASGDVILTLGNVTIFTDEAEFSQSTSIIRASGAVRLFKGRQVFNAEEIFYNVETEEVTASHIRSSLEPFYYETNKIVVPTDGDAPVFMENAIITTHDAANPSYKITARSLTIYPDDKVVVRGARLNVKDRNILGLPYYVQPLDGELGFSSVPGWNSAWGAHVTNRYGFEIGDDYLAHANLDYRTERGIAGGIEVWDRKWRHNPNIGRLKLYYAQDTNPQIRFNGTSRSEDIDNERYRINLQHRVFLPTNKDEDFFVDIDINTQSDARIIEDFFPNEFRTNPQEDNLVNVTKRFDWGEASFVNRFDFNDFFQTDTRNEFALDVIRTPLGGSNFFYNGTTTFGRIDEQFGNDSPLESFATAEDLEDPLSSYTRLYSYHEIGAAHNIGGWLSAVPRAGVGYQRYSDLDVPGSDSFDRAIYHAGLDLSFKLSKRNPNVRNKKLGLDGILHVARPYVNYAITGTDEINGQFNGIDRETPTTRLRPIDVAGITEVDDFSDQHVIRSGLSNKWFTRRNGANFEWLSINNYFEYYIEDSEFDESFSNLFSDIRFNPVPWLGFQSTFQLPVLDNSVDFTEITTRAHFMPTDWFRFSAGHFHLNDHEFFDDADLFSLETYTRLGEDWGFSTAHRYDSDDGVLELQQYAVHKDLGSWVARVGATVRDNRITEPQFGVFFGLTLKAFPTVSIAPDFEPGGGF